ncbi:hypothetical protein E2562_000316 [Oryza meyeriana var. granulata]|uniref:Polysaccharide biosynthesis domain-containing protein n=1 Tax=Oryza meyeriana var. granulata TaxID=110450 RepID=A0A6G1CLA3_9ORYZ|nr:hypothetical protein E2562_000316 [Oryza meyeriana var. granulata]
MAAAGMDFQVGARMVPRRGKAILGLPRCRVAEVRLMSEEVRLVARALARRSPCGLLVFGLGHDSAMWAALNHGGRTVFLEEDVSWIAAARSMRRSAGLELEAYHVQYDTKWDVILVDAPTGYAPWTPGRMGAIYAAGMAARARRGGGTDVFVHDVDRAVEDAFSRTFLCDAYVREEAGKLRHFVVHSHRREGDGMAPPFCPSSHENAKLSTQQNQLLCILENQLLGNGQNDPRT